MVSVFLIRHQIKTGAFDYGTFGIAQDFTTAKGLKSAPTKKIVQTVSIDDPSVGPRDAKLTIVEFGDFECPFCKKVFPTIREMMALYGDRVFFQFRDFPIVSEHQFALPTAEAGECAYEQGADKFWQYHDKLFQNQGRFQASDLVEYGRQIGLDEQKFTQCLLQEKYKTEVFTDLQDGLNAGVSGTPTFFINGVKIAGVIPRELFIKLIEQELAQ